MTAPAQAPSDGMAFWCRDLGRQFGATIALTGINLAVPEGAFFLLVGANGAGKTTLLSLLLDCLSPTSGESRVFGLDPVRHGGRVRAAIGYVPEDGSWPFDRMTVARFLAHHATYRPRWDARYAAHLSRVLDLRLDRPIRHLSKGEFRRAQLVVALAHRPAGLILDEPTDGLDPMIRDRLKEVLADHLSDGPATVLVSTHLVHETEGFADHLGIMRAGRLALSLPREVLDRDVRRICLTPPPNGWTVPTLPRSVRIRREVREREERWTIMGPQEPVLAVLQAAGATVTDVRPLDLEDAAVALLASVEEAARSGAEVGG